MLNPIRLIVTDVDGCLTEERATAFNMANFAWLRDYNAKAQAGESHFAPLTLCTGRPQPYMEALVKMLNITLPAISENGGILYELKTNRYTYLVDDSGAGDGHLLKLKKKIGEQILPQFETSFQPGKETHLTLISHDHPTIEKVRQKLENDFHEDLNGYLLTISENCVNIVPGHFDKGTALIKLSNLLEIPLQQMAAIGDTEADIPFMQLVGYPMCPANAVPAVKSICHYVAEKRYTAGLIEIIDKCVEINRRLEKNEVSGAEFQVHS
ncbi:HAD-IIB family hydrolase [candidate division KSB1 bacterium]|nr:HAD-IIB family hydrolase [candidate division KSB1 bacterium]